eukprot:3695507-Alexandrium_andersonii.AAC.1
MACDATRSRHERGHKRYRKSPGIGPRPALEAVRCGWSCCGCPSGRVGPAVRCHAAPSLRLPRARCVRVGLAAVR